MSFDVLYFGFQYNILKTFPIKFNMFDYVSGCSKSYLIFPAFLYDFFFNYISLQNYQSELY